MFDQLNLLDVSVIYVALGAPLGIYHIAKHWNDSLPSVLALAVANIFLWPAAALVVAYGQFKEPAEPISLDPAIQLSTLEHTAQKVLSTEELFAFRECTLRYVGISQAFQQPVGTSAVEGLFEIDNVIAGGAAKACSIRRNLAKLGAHQFDARENFLDQVRVAASRDRSVLPMARDLAIVLGDHVAAAELYASRRSEAGGIHVSSDRISLAA